MEIDWVNSQVRTETGDAVSYDHLVLTTGSRSPRLPDVVGRNLNGVLTMRDPTDAEAASRRLDVLVPIK